MMSDLSQNELKRRNDMMLKVLKLVYLKHHCGKDVIGWDALSEKLGNVLPEVMGDDKFRNWLDEEIEDEP